MTVWEVDEKDVGKPDSPIKKFISWLFSDRKTRNPFSQHRPKSKVCSSGCEYLPAQH